MALRSIAMWPFDPLRRRQATRVATNDPHALASLLRYDALDWRSQLRLAYLLVATDPAASDSAFRAAYDEAKARN
jgi:hypothetical protein